MNHQSKLKHYVKSAIMTDGNPYPAVSSPRMKINSDIDSGLNHFTMTCWPVSKPFTMVSHHHRHDYDQIMIFSGGDLTDVNQLGGEVEITLSEDGIEEETFTLTTATQVYIPGGLYHCPLTFTRIDNPAKPLFFQYLFFEPSYAVS